MATSTFSIQEALSFSWQAYWRRWLFWVGVVVVVALTPQLVRFADLPGVSWVVAVIAALVVYYVQLVFTLGWMSLALNTVDGHDPTFATLFSRYDIITLKLLAVNIITGLVTVAGLFLFVIPGIYIGLRLQFAPYALVDRDRGVFEALSHSWSSTQGQAWQLVGYWLTIMVINIVGMLALGVGLLVSIPVAALAAAHVYRQLSPLSASQPDATTGSVPPAAPAVPAASSPPPAPGA